MEIWCNHTDKRISNMFLLNIGSDVCDSIRAVKRWHTFLKVAFPKCCEPQIIYQVLTPVQTISVSQSLRSPIYATNITGNFLRIFINVLCVGIQALHVSWKLRTHKPALITTAYLLSRSRLITRHQNNIITHARHVPKETQSSIFNPPQRHWRPQRSECLLKFASWASVSYSRVLF